MNTNIEVSLELLKDAELVDFKAEDGCRYACCGNCRYYDGDGWCGYHRTSTTGGDHCGSWEDYEEQRSTRNGAIGFKRGRGACPSLFFNQIWMRSSFKKTCEGESTCESG